MRKKWLGIASVFVLAVILAVSAKADDPIRLYVNGREIQPEVPPQLVNGRTMVPLRWVAEALGADVQWDAANRAVVVNSSYPVNKGSLPRVLENLGAWFEGVEIPVYVPAYLPGGGDLAVTEFRTTKDGYSFKVVRRDGGPVSLAEEVVSVEAAQQPFPPYPSEAQVFSATPETVEVDGRQVASYNSGTGAKWRQGDWEFVTIGGGLGEGLTLARAIIRSLPENVSPVPGAAQGKLRASRLGNPLHVTAGWTYDGRTWYTLDGRSSVEEMVKMLQ
ncbi:MAG: copper amine oxidase N-terminal domain-containing protein, partial [Clostridia bacterium]|nr:copper amine oxidase N-terminal domain-containing protein [Clostridia bacterium]